jgi:hypothetical protein
MPRERREPVRPHDSVTRHRRVIAGPHDVADGPGGERASGDHRDEAVRRDATGRDALYDATDAPVPVVR